ACLSSVTDDGTRTLAGFTIRNASDSPDARGEIGERVRRGSDFLRHGDASLRTGVRCDITRRVDDAENDAAGVPIDGIGRPFLFFSQWLRRDPPSGRWR